MREARIHRNAWGCVLRSSIYVRSLYGELTQQIVRKFRRRIVHRSLGKARHHTSSLDVSRYLPLGFAYITVFRKDYRRRRLTGFGLGEDLVCTIEVKRIRRIRCPDIMGATIEELGKYRIAWNKSWLERQTSPQQ